MAKMIGGVLGAGLAVLQAASAHAQAPPVVQRWIARLQAQGYTVTQGTAVAYTTAYCQATNFTVFHTCFNTDASDLYVLALVPQGLGYVDPFYTPQTTVTLPGGTVVGSSYHLDATEAVVSVITLPPPAAYLSYQTYLFTRPVADYAVPVQSVSPDPARAVIFGSFADSIDNVLIARQSGLGFGQGAVGTITTANADLAQRLAQNFTAVGGPAAELFTEPMGANTDPGLDAASDDFTSVIRYLAPATDRGVTWRQNAASNVLVYRIGQPAGLSVTRFPIAAFTAKSVNAPEAGHAANLAELTGLLQGWLAGQEGRPVSARQAKTGEGLDAAGVPISGEFGPFCISAGHNCAGDSQDTDAYKYVIAGTVPASSAVIMAGVDHTVTGNTTYLGIGAEDTTTGTGEVEPYQVDAAATGFAAGTITGSAGAALSDLGLLASASPQLRADLPNLFVQFFARDCVAGVAYCGKSYTSALTTALVPLAHKVSVWERAYVLPGHPNGANPKLLVNPYVIY